jgi:hypothetical protein
MRLSIPPESRAAWKVHFFALNRVARLAAGGDALTSYMEQVSVAPKSKIRE